MMAAEEGATQEDEQEILDDDVPAAQGVSAAAEAAAAEAGAAEAAAAEATGAGVVGAEANSQKSAGSTDLGWLEGVGRDCRETQLERALADEIQQANNIKKKPLEFEDRGPEEYQQNPAGWMADAEKQLLEAFSKATGLSQNQNASTEQDTYPDEEMWSKLAENRYVFAIKGTAIGGRWTRALKHESKLKEDYELQPTKELKEAFRARWAKGKHTTVVAKHVHEESVTRDEVSEGKWSTLASMASRHGGGNIQLGMRAAVNIALDCIRQGASRVRMNTRSKTLEFVDIEDGFKEKHRNKWGITETGGTTYIAEEKQEEEEDKQDEAKPAGKRSSGKPASKAVAKSRPGKAAKTAAGQTAGGSGGDGGVKAMLLKAKRAKMHHAAVTATLSMIRSSINREASWNFMKIPEMSKPMNDAAEQLDAYIAENEFVAAAILTDQDVSKLKPQYPGGRFDMGLELLTKGLEDKVRSLEIQLNSVVAQQKVIVQAAQLAAETPI